MTVHRAPRASPGRVDWADYAKGFCIIMVVMMHSTLGVEEAAGREGFMHALVAFAKPFRMPDFFLISGLFLSRVIDRDWRTYLDRKVVHFAYFYVLWVTIQFARQGAAFRRRARLALCRRAIRARLHRSVRHAVVHLPAADLLRGDQGDAEGAARCWSGSSRRRCRSAQIDTGWTAIDEFAGRFVYFYTGYLDGAAGLCPCRSCAGAAACGDRWALCCGPALDGALVFTGLAGLPLISLALGFVGACAVVSLSALMAKAKLFDPVRYCGQHSIVIYLAFFLPMAATRTLLLRIGITSDVGVMAIVITTAGVIGALLLWWALRSTRANFLFERPAFFHLSPPLGLQPAE